MCFLFFNPLCLKIEPNIYCVFDSIFYQEAAALRKKKRKAEEKKKEGMFSGLFGKKESKKEDEKGVYFNQCWVCLILL